MGVQVRNLDDKGGAKTESLLLLRIRRRAAFYVFWFPALTLLVMDEVGLRKTEKQSEERGTINPNTNL